MYLICKDIAAAVLFRAVFWAARVFGENHDVCGITFVDLEGSESAVGSKQICNVLESAFGELAAAGVHFEASVRDNITHVCRHRMSGRRSTHQIRTYESPFDEAERNDPRLLAAHLVWAAKYFEVVALGPPWSSHKRIARAEWEAYQSRDWFVRQFPGWQDWLDHVRSFDVA